MGYRVPFRMTGGIPALVYIAELRASPFTHPTLQERAMEVADTLEESFAEFGLKLYVDRENQGRFDARRGHQDITEKKS